jgi:type VI secretion system protein ImpM
MDSLAPGWFGKVALLGDFASRRLAPEWIQGCDGWLSAAMQASQSALGEQWKEAYLSAPVWRFAWGPGVVDASWWFGVMMASCDNVGRYFPLVVVQSRPRPPADRFALEHLDLWWRHLVDASVQTLSAQASLEDFEDALDHAPPWPSYRLRGWIARQDEAGKERYVVEPGAALSDAAAALAAQDLARRLEGCSLWWSVGAPEGASRCAVQRGLPPAAAFADLLTGTF